MLLLAVFDFAMQRAYYVWGFLFSFAYTCFSLHVKGDDNPSASVDPVAKSAAELLLSQDQAHPAGPIVRPDLHIGSDAERAHVLAQVGEALSWGVSG